jgi:hypothetical protein
MNMFAEAGVPDEMLPAHLRKESEKIPQVPLASNPKPDILQSAAGSVPDAQQQPKAEGGKMVGDQLKQIQAAGQAETLTVRVEHSKGYTGKRSGKSYLARVNGMSKEYGLDREFLEPDDRDYGDSQLYKKSKGSWHEIHTIQPDGGVYDIATHGESVYRVYFPKVKDGKVQLVSSTVQRDELKQAITLLKHAGMDVDELPKAMSDSKKEDGTLIDRVRRWTRHHMDSEVAEAYEGDVEAMRSHVSDAGWVARQRKGYVAAVRRALGETEA